MAIPDFQGRRALVTGAARGIGRCIVSALLEQGCRVVLTDVDTALLQETANALDPHGERTLALELDVTDASRWAQVVETVTKQWGGLDILVNNAGIMLLGKYLELEPRLDRRQLDINVFGVMNGQRAVLPGMLARGSGHVVNIASAAGQVGVPFAAVYSATKFAVVGLTEAVAYEYRDSGVGFTAVCPSVVETGLIDGAGRPRWPPVAKPEQVAKAVIRAIEGGKELVFIPRVARLSAILPAILPRRVARKVAEFLKMGDMFDEVDSAARDSYRNRTWRS